MKYSFITFFIFALSGIFVVWTKRNGYNRIYENVGDYGILYLIFSLLALIFLRDTYFYWTHRMMHHKFLFKHFHLVHHKSINPSPWAVFSFHPLKAIIEAGIVPIVSFCPSSSSWCDDRIFRLYDLVKRTGSSFL